ncbi:ATP-binding protein [Dactylosporangium sp. CA-052675]|uniref:ATP-binding protein n=1 Tax=Dactylosporangium sp. CA-052675 TaxID=3239927 RepID=UPI003D8D1330
MTSQISADRGGPATHFAAVNAVTAMRQRLLNLKATSPDLYEEADRAEMEAIRALQAANRHLNYVRRRPSRYADATYDTLYPDQDPRGLVSGWWTRGPRTLVLAGPSRTGKTTAAYAIANVVHNLRNWVIAWTAADLSAALKPDGDPAAYDHAVACDLLVIDDLGRERVTDWWLEQLQRVVDARCGNERRLIITTNAAPDPAQAYELLVARYGDPLVERLIDGGGVVTLDGAAVRKVVTDW